VAVPNKYSHIDFIPPKSVAIEAVKGLKYRELAGGKGGLSVEQAKAEGVGSGVQRAVNLKNRDKLASETVKRMKALFDRHQKNKIINPKYKNEPWKDRGYVAWLIWGGDAGYSWAKKIVEQMEKADLKSKKARVIVAYFINSSEISHPAILTWNEIKNYYNKKYGENHHHLKLICTECGNISTCRCSSNKIIEYGICPDCCSSPESNKYFHDREHDEASITASKKPDLIFTIGIPGSGKSWWIKSQKSHVIISPDSIRKELTGDISDQSANIQAWAIAKRKVSESLKHGKDVILDATNLISFYRKQFLENLPPHNLKAKIFEISPEIAKERIKKDVERKIERAKVPDEVIDRMHEQFKKTVNEGELQTEGFDII